MKVGDHSVSVGIHAQEAGEPKITYDGEESSETLGEVAFIHEFGDRSWIRPWWDRNIKRLRIEVKAAMQKELKGDKRAIYKLAAYWEQELRDWLLTGEANLKPLAESTIKEKSKYGYPSTPLIATKQLVSAIRSMVDGQYV
jgi:hypothetical protein